MSFFGSLLGGVAGGLGSWFGANAQADAQKKAAELQYQQYQQTKALMQPFVDTGTTANAVYANLAGINGAQAQSAALANLAQDPFMRSIQNYATDQTLAAAGRGGAGVSGNALSALYNNAGTLYDQWLNQQIGNINNLAQRGASTAGALAGYGQQSAQSQGNYLAGAGQTMGAGIMGAGNAIGNMANNYGVLSALRSPTGSSSYGIPTLPSFSLF